MTKEQAEFIVGALTDQGYAGEIREDYSGRNMFGKTTTGVVAESFFDIIGAVLAQISDNKAMEIPDFSQFMCCGDSMGHDIIIY